MTNEKKITENPDADTWISIDDVARMLDLKKKYASQCIRKGFLKGSITYRNVSGRNIKYNLADVKKVLELATVPAKRL